MTELVQRAGLDPQAQRFDMHLIAHAASSASSAAARSSVCLRCGAGDHAETAKPEHTAACDASLGVVAGHALWPSLSFTTCATLGGGLIVDSHVICTRSGSRGLHGANAQRVWR